MLKSACSRRSLLALSPLALTGWTQEPAAASTSAVTVVSLRHAETAEKSRDPELSEAGSQRAQAWAHLLAAAPVTHLLTTDYKRTRSTIAPLARARSLEPTLYDPRQPKQILRQVQAAEAGSVVVIAGHSNTVPQLVALLGGELAGLDERGFLGEKEHDRLILQTVMRSADDAPRALQTLDLRLPA